MLGHAPQQDEHHTRRAMGTLVGEMGDGFLRNVLGNDSYRAVSGDEGAPSGGEADSAEPTAQERHSQAENEIARAADAEAAAEAERYRANRADESAHASGEMYGQLGSGGGYRLDPDQLAAQITEWEDIVEEMKSIRDGIRNAGDVIYSPTADNPATSQAASAKRSILQGGADYRAQIRYAEGLIRSLRKAHGSYVEEDEETGQVFDKKGDNESGGPDGTGSLFDKKGGQ